MSVFFNVWKLPFILKREIKLEKSQMFQETGLYGQCLPYLNVPRMCLVCLLKAPIGKNWLDNGLK